MAVYLNDSNAHSHSTLVNPEAPIELVCATNDSLNTYLLVNGVPRYKIFTPGPGEWSPGTVTDLETKEVIVKIPKRLLGPDTVIFPGKYEGKEMKKRKWLARSVVKSGQ